jgi:hypothetical protein
MTAFAVELDDFHLDTMAATEPPELSKELAAVHAVSDPVPLPGKQQCRLA